MTSSILPKISSKPYVYRPFLKNLIDLYEKMDTRYNEASIHYSFVCRGCDENCCRTKFYHHTYLEYLYLKEGFDALFDEKKHTIIKMNKKSLASILEDEPDSQNILCLRENS